MQLDHPQSGLGKAACVDLGIYNGIAGKGDVMQQDNDRRCLDVKRLQAL